MFTTLLKIGLCHDVLIFHIFLLFSRNGSFARSYPNLAVCGTNSASPKKSNPSLTQIRLHHEVTGDIICPSMVMGNYPDK